ncbi:fibropellin-3-like isoform X3 [Acanthaster planci]|uniref:Fibropellin-3-like isoform X3 n=1 Tax=Acanthaster planci TaxID=133434 RepID=A0A8B7YWU6_ACAPL|nr:fibropellin-3-like isoform X3 [Acanthaster planci]
MDHWLGYLLLLAACFAGNTVIANESTLCDSMPCLNGGACFDLSAFYFCVCDVGFGGQNCQIDISGCSSNPCMNNGTCERLREGYSCTCQPFYSGDNCETEMRPCMSDPCLNGATCMDNSIESYTCFCQAGYSGSNCETDINECASNPCANNGTCEDLLNMYSCTCPSFYSGVNCETEVRPCMSDPCMNGATCSDVSTDFYVCFCEPGYTGFDCESDIDECMESPCANGGTCRNTFGGYDCQCNFMWTGQNCTERNPSITGVTEVLNNQSTVFWNFDREDERFIQGFILQYRESHVSVYTNTSLIPASERNYTLTNLKPGTLYLLRLLAIDRDANPAAASFQKPVMTLSRDIMDPVPVTDQRSKPKMDSFHWILISSAALVILLLTIVIVGILIFTRKKPKRKPSGADDQTKEEHRV